jgi:hypothetical protein
MVGPRGKRSLCVESSEVGKFIVSSSSLTSDFFIDPETWQLIQLRILVEKLGHSEITTAGSYSVKKAYAFFLPQRMSDDKEFMRFTGLAHLKRGNAEVSNLSATYSWFEAKH